MVGIYGSDVHLFLGHRLLDNLNIIGKEGLGYIDKIDAGVPERLLSRNANNRCWND
jgi:threonine dehydrogenase-like Zn-dependent dehydrogenase